MSMDKEYTAWLDASCGDAADAFAAGYEAANDWRRLRDEPPTEAGDYRIEISMVDGDGTPVETDHVIDTLYIWAEGTKNEIPCWASGDHYESSRFVRYRFSGPIPEAVE